MNNCDERSTCTYLTEAPPDAGASPTAKPKRQLVATRSAPSKRESAAPAHAPGAVAAETSVPFALALSLSFAPPPMPEPRVSPTTCLLERAFSDVQVAEPTEGELKPRLFERGVKMLAGKIGQSNGDTN